MDKAAQCKYFDKVTACYPKCVCDDALHKASIDATKKSMETYGCTFKCGAAAASTPSSPAPPAPSPGYSSAPSVGSCAADEATKWSQCTTAIPPPETSVDKAALCKYYDKVTACSPKCICDDAAWIDATKKAMETYGCTFKCGAAAAAAGAAAGLRASAFTVFIAAVVSLVSVR